MQAINESGDRTAAIHCAAVKPGIDFTTIRALPDEIVADLEIDDQHGTSLFQDGERITEMIVVAVHEQHMRDALDLFLPPLVPGQVIR